MNITRHGVHTPVPCRWLNSNPYSAAASKLPHIGRAVLNERCLAKPVTPLTRHWAGKLGVAIA